MQEEASEFAAFIGIDWADRKHDVCLQLAGRRPSGRPVAVCLELSQGPTRPSDCNGQFGSFRHCRHRGDDAAVPLGTRRMLMLSDESEGISMSCGTYNHREAFGCPESLRSAAASARTADSTDSSSRTPTITGTPARSVASLVAW